MILVYIFLAVAVVYLSYLTAKLLDKLCRTVEKIDEIHEKLVVRQSDDLPVDRSKL